MTILLDLIVIFFFFQLFSQSNQLISDNIDNIDIEENSKIRMNHPKKRTIKEEIINEEILINHNENYSNNFFSKFYENNSVIDFTITDFEYLFRSKIITKKQAGLIWENLLNSKTERNLEWLEYGKYIKSSLTNNSGNSGVHKKKELKLFLYLSLLFNTNEFRYNSLYAYLGGIFFYLLSKFLFKYPKLDIVLLFLLSVFNIMNSFYFYEKKFYFSSSISLYSFLSNIYYIYINILILAGEKEVDCSIFSIKQFKSKKYFYMKISITIFLFIVQTYLTNLGLRFHLNYILSFFLLEKVREMVTNYTFVQSPEYFQPIGNFYSVILGIILFIYTQIIYFINLNYSYEFNSFLLVNNTISFFYFCYLDKLIYIQKNNLGGEFITYQKINGKKDNFEIIDYLSQKFNLKKFHRSESLYSNNKRLTIMLCVICFQVLIFALLFQYYYCYLISFVLLYSIHRHCLIFINIKESRLISGFFFFIFHFLIYHLKKIPYTFINEIIAIYDKKFLEGVFDFIKLGFYCFTTFCIFMNDDFFDLFNIWNYSTYKYINFGLSTKVSKTLRAKNKDIFNLYYVFEEIFGYNIRNSIGIIRKALENISDSQSLHSIETLVKRDYSNKFVFFEIIDYFTNYYTIILLNMIFSNINNSFYFTLYVINRFLIYSKMLLLFFEYSKTGLQKEFFFMLNLIFIQRLSNLPDLDKIDYYLNNIVKLLLFIIYSLLINIPSYLNWSIIIFFLLYFNVYPDYFYFLPLIIFLILTKLYLNDNPIIDNRINIFLGISFILLTSFFYMDQDTTKWANKFISSLTQKIFCYDYLDYISHCFFEKKNYKKDYIEFKIFYFQNQIFDTWKNIFQE